MSRLTTENQTHLPRSFAEEGQDRSRLIRQVEPLEPSPGLLLTGMVAIGLGALAWYYLGPDIKRYLKIRNM